jgi:MraZ protein
MRPFLSTYTNRVDAKGRISVPAKFRAVLADQEFQGVVCFPSFTGRCIEGVTMKRMEELSAMIDNDFAPFDETFDAFATSVLADSYELPFDKEGRVLLPDDLLDFAEIGAEATFVGLGKRFQIWQPEAYAAHRAAARERARESRGLLGPQKDAEDKDSEALARAGARSSRIEGGRR